MLGACTSRKTSTSSVLRDSNIVKTSKSGHLHDTTNTLRALRTRSIFDRANIYSAHCHSQKGCVDSVGGHCRVGAVQTWNPSHWKYHSSRKRQQTTVSSQSDGFR